MNRHVRSLEDNSIWFMTASHYVIKDNINNKEKVSIDNYHVSTKRISCKTI